MIAKEMKVEVKAEPELICDACEKNKAIGVACVPMVPCSMAYCQECLQHNSHPMNVLIANTACIGGLDNANKAWKRMVLDSLEHQSKTLDWFTEQVTRELKGDNDA